MKKLYLGLLFTALTHGTACLNAAESNSPLSAAIRCDGAKDSNVSHGQKVFYLSKDFAEKKSWNEIEACIRKVDNKNCHSFYVMERVGDEDKGYKMKEAFSFDAAAGENVYFAWDGSEDLTGAGKDPDDDLSQFKYDPSQLITNETTVNTSNEITTNEDPDPQQGDKSSMLWLIPAIGIPVVTGLLLFHQYNRTQEVKAPKRASKV